MADQYTCRYQPKAQFPLEQFLSRPLSFREITYEVTSHECYGQ